jgi:hypothetical protein
LLLAPMPFSNTTTAYPLRTAQVLAVDAQPTTPSSAALVAVNVTASRLVVTDPLISPP